MDSLRLLFLRPRLLAAAWLLHIFFAALAAGPGAALFVSSLQRRPLASQALLDGFSWDMWVDWRAAYGGSLGIYLAAAVAVAVAYAAATVVLESVLLPAWLRPFDPALRDGERLRRAAAKALPGLASVSLTGVALWLLLAFAVASLSKLVLIPAPFLLVALNLWKCARVSGPGTAGVSPAFVLRRRPWYFLALAAATVLAPMLYALLAGAISLYALNSSRVVLAIALEQLAVVIIIFLRLWLLCSATLLYRTVQTAR